MKKFLSILSHVMPNTSAQILLNLFLRPRRYKRPKKEQKVWEQGQKIVFPGGIHARLFHPKKERLLVFIHGWSGRGSQFYKFVEAFDDYAILLVDGPAHGDSDGGITNLPIFARQVSEALQVYNDRIYAFVGHSFGGMSVILSAMFGLKAKKRVVMGSPYQSAKVIEVFCKKFRLHEDTPKRLIELIETMAGVTLEQVDHHPHFKKSESELLIVHDEEDRSVPIDRAESLHAAYRGSEFYRTEGLGHSRILYDADVIKRVKDFIEA